MRAARVVAAPGHRKIARTGRGGHSAVGEEQAAEPDLGVVRRRGVRVVEGELVPVVREDQDRVLLASAARRPSTSRRSALPILLRSRIIGPATMFATTGLPVADLPPGPPRARTLAAARAVPLPHAVASNSNILRYEASDTRCATLGIELVLLSCVHSPLSIFATSPDAPVDSKRIMVPRVADFAARAFALAATNNASLTPCPCARRPPP